MSARRISPIAHRISVRPSICTHSNISPSLEPARAAAHQAIVEALREQGITVRTITSRPAKTATELQNDCTQVICAATLLSSLRFDLAVALAVWQGDDGPQTNITIVDAAGNKYPGYAIIAGNDAAAAARAALLEARSLHLLGPGPWIHVRGNPAGADVLIDDKHVGVLPYRGALSPGDHQLQLRASGFAAKQQPIAVPFEATTITRVELDLMPEPTAQTPTSVPVATDSYVQPSGHVEHDEPSAWNFILGGVLAAGGVALATIEPIQSFARDGDCSKNPCSRRYSVGTDTALQITFGALASVAGVTLILWQPLRVDATASDQHAVLRATLTL